MGDAMAQFDPAKWEGDVGDLSPEIVERLLSNADDCSETFPSKSEAFAAGVSVGKRTA